jgi:hypothetical protein
MAADLNQKIKFGKVAVGNGDLFSNQSSGPSKPWTKRGMARAEEIEVVKLTDYRSGSVL